MICKKLFKLTNNNQKFCSAVCSQQAKLTYGIKYRLHHKINKKLYNMKRHLKYRNKLLKQMRDWYKRNKIKIIKQKILYNQIKYKTNLIFRLIINFRNRTRLALKKNWKSGHTLKLLGCSIDFLKQHLESQFKPGMTWKNYGLWHIDHIKPCAKFDLSKSSEQRKCFHYKNLQPLWAKENISKGDKYV
jgi:hypothetical protein